jgi:hypothetical protein
VKLILLSYAPILQDNQNLKRWKIFNVLSGDILMIFGFFIKKMVELIQYVTYCMSDFCENLIVTADWSMSTLICEAPTCL